MNDGPAPFDRTATVAERAPGAPSVVAVVPCFNESRTLHSLVLELRAATKHFGFVTILLVDDGSTDGTANVIAQLVGAVDGVEEISFTRNFGKEAAMLAGLDFAVERGSGVMFVDGDGQHPPLAAAKLVEASVRGAHHVVAHRDRGDESRFRRGVAQVGYRLLSSATQVSFVNGHGDFRLLSAHLARALAEMPERVRFSKGLYALLGEPDEVVEFDAPDLDQGRKSSWGFRSLLNYAIDGATGFNSKPLRAVFALGLVSAALSAGYSVVALLQTMRSGIEEPGYLTTIIAVLFLGSLQLVSLGVIGEYVGRILAEVKQRPHYLVRESAVVTVDDAGAPVHGQ